ncbi:MAG: hypothetical protein LC793_13875 [Thermomicrobia bacterium]|nr:hypothetical protein [Thermomicrobia bacterium]MCA1723143.1 hypothetical protein [Thermomicrobia bacterium]
MLDKDISRRDAMKTALKAGAYAAPVILTAAIPATGVAAATPPVPPAACTRPFMTELAPSGTGTGGTLQSLTNCGTGFFQFFRVTLTGAPANTAYDVYLDQNSAGTAASHIFAGTFSTDAAGNATFSSKITVPVAATQLDNEIVLHDPTHSNYTQHQFIQDTFPLTGACLVPCATLAPLSAGPSLQTGVGTKSDAPHP